MESIMNRNDTVLSLQGSKGGGAVNLEAGLSDSEGFYLVIAPTGTEGLLKVTLKEATESCVLPFFYGYNNAVLVKQVHVDEGNTAAGAYWYK